MSSDMFVKRIFEFQKLVGMKDVRLAEIMGISKSAISTIKKQLEDGKEVRNVGSDKIERLVLNTELNANWLITGEGDILRSENVVSVNSGCPNCKKLEAELLNCYRQLNSQREGSGRETDDRGGLHRKSGSVP